jgi:flagellar basal-body rod modification protein FlgD
VTNPSGTQSFPSMTPAETAAAAKAAGATPVAPGSTDPLTGAAGGALGKTAFLKLLVQEMTNQDPLKPADNTEFIAQLAQFSTLEQMQNMNDGFGKLQTSFQSAEARGLLGVQVDAVNSSTGADVNGVVDQIIVNSDGSIQVDVNGTPVSIGEVIKVGPGATPTTTTPTTGSGAASASNLPGTVVPPTNGTGTGQ